MTYAIFAKYKSEVYMLITNFALYYKGPSYNILSSKFCLVKRKSLISHLLSTFR